MPSQRGLRGLLDRKARRARQERAAGACSSFWLAFHPDLADPKSTDPIARETESGGGEVRRR